MAKRISAKNKSPIEGLYWETRWFRAYNEANYDFRRPCSKGLAKYFQVPFDRRFKICFAARTTFLLPGAHGSYYPENHPDAAVFLLVRRTSWTHDLLLHGFQRETPLQWWVEIEEIEEC